MVEPVACCPSDGDRLQSSSDSQSPVVSTEGMKTNQEKEAEESKQNRWPGNQQAGSYLTGFILAPFGFFKFFDTIFKPTHKGPKGVLSLALCSM